MCGSRKKIWSSLTYFNYRFSILIHSFIRCYVFTSRPSLWRIWIIASGRSSSSCVRMKCLWRSKRRRRTHYEMRNAGRAIWFGANYRSTLDKVQMYLNDEIECAILSVLHQLDEHQKWRRIARYCTYLTNVFWHVSDAVTVPSDRHFPREHDKNKKERKKSKMCRDDENEAKVDETNCKAISNPNIWRYLNRQNRIASECRMNVTNTLWPLRYRESISKWQICCSQTRRLCVRCASDRK